MIGKDEPFDWEKAWDEIAEANRKDSLEREVKAETPEGKAKRQAEIEKEIRQGLRDAEGNWIDQPEADEDEEEDEE